MARKWGGWTSTSSSGQRFRLGVDYSVSGTTITINYYVLEAAYPINQNNLNLDRQQGLTGSRTVSANTSGGVVNLGAGGSVTGSRGSSVRFRARTTNIYNGLNPSFDFTIDIPAAPPSKPAAPTISNVGTTTATATLGSAPANNGASIIRYEWELEGGTNPANTTGRTRSLSGLTANKSYRVRVRAVNSAGASSWSNWSSSFTTKPLDPLAPTNVSATRANDARVDVGWTRNTTSERPVTSQRVERQETDANGSWGNWTSRGTVSGTATSFADTSVSTNKQYRYRVVAINSGGSTLSSASSSVRTTPAAPTMGSTTKVGNDIQVTYTANTPYSDYLTHILQDSPNGGAWVTVKTQIGTGALVHEDPDPGVTHRYRVITRSTYGGNLDSPPSATSDVVQLQAPPLAPTITHPTAGVYDAISDVIPRWQHNPVDASEQRKAEVRYRMGTSGSWTTEVLDNWPYGEGLIDAPDAEGTLQFQVRTWGDHPDPSPWSATRTITVAYRPFPVINQPTPGVLPSSTFVLEWGYSQPSNSPQVAWEGRLLDEAGRLLETKTANTSNNVGVFDTTLEDNATYTAELRVRAANGLWSHESDWPWERVTVTTHFPLPVCYTTETLWDPEAGAVGLTFSPADEPLQYAWSGVPNESASTRTDASGTVTNLFTNPDMRATLGEVVVWENRSLNPRGGHSWGSFSNGSWPIQTRTDPYSPLEGLTSVLLERTLTSPTSTVATATYIGAGAPTNSAPIPVTPGETIQTNIWVACSRDRWETAAIPFFYREDNSVYSVSGERVEATPDSDGWFRYSSVIEVPADAVGVRFSQTVYSVPGEYAQQGDRAWFCGHTVAPIPEFFDEEYSFDPDLTPQPRPGGGSQLVGQRVAGISSFGEVFGDPGVAIVQSTQWSKSGGESARIITTKDFSAEEPLAQLFATMVYMSSQSPAPSGSVSFWVRQDSEIGEVETIPEFGLGGRIVFASFEDYEGTGELIPNGPGEGIVRVFADTPPEEPSDGTAVQLFAGVNLGDSIWLDLVTITDTEDYEGPPFSGSSQSLVEADYLTVYRRDPDGTVATIADFIDPESSVIDPIPGIGEVEYWAVSKTNLPSSNECSHTIVPLYDGTLRECPIPEGGIPVYSAWLNAGEGYEDFAKAFYDLEINEPEVGLSERIRHRYSGRPFPIEVSGIGQVQRVELTFTTAENTPSWVGEGGISDIATWRDFARRPAPFWFRDHTGRKFQCSIEPISIQAQSPLGGHYRVTLQLTRIDEEPFLILGDAE